MVPIPEDELVATEPSPVPNAGNVAKNRSLAEASIYAKPRLRRFLLQFLQVRSHATEDVRHDIHINTRRLLWSLLTSNRNIAGDAPEHCKRVGGGVLT